MKTVVIDGIRFTKSGGKKYHYNSTIRKHLHQYVWTRANGNVPKGWEVHHIDGNTDNNDISNLTALPIVEHKAVHTEQLRNDPKRLAKMRLNLIEKAVPKASEWHGSSDGIEWHKEHYESMKHLLHLTDTFKCEQCHIDFEAVATGSNRFCSNKCKSKWRRDSGLDDVIRKCEQCNDEFKTNKYSKTIYCSKSCASKGRWEKRKDSLDLQEKQL